MAGRLNLNRWRRTEEEKAAARAQAQARREQRAEERREAAYAASPLGQAEAAASRGDAFLEVRQASGAELGRIEDLGWHLEHVSHVFVQTNSSTSVYSDGDSSTSIDGYVCGVYLFRAISQSAAKHELVEHATREEARNA